MKERSMFVLVACHEVVCAIPIQDVDRLYSEQEVAFAGRPEEGAVVGAATVRKTEHRAVDLGRLLEMPPVSGTWVSLAPALQVTRAPVLLRSGPCLFVESLADVSPLAPAVFARHPGVIVAAFQAKPRARAGMERTALGLVLDARALVRALAARSPAARSNAGVGA